jgi:hypothetical protein
MQKSLRRKDQILFYMREDSENEPVTNRLITEEQNGNDKLV